MNNGETEPAAPMGENLIFILSQPRSGSTLLQRVLWAHPSIHTAGEPWLLLHPLFGLREEGITAPYDGPAAAAQTRAFLETFPGGEESYYRGVGLMVSHIYGACLAGREATLFLDKTPRYYYVIPELARTFPGAKFIVLLRDPMAVLSSVLSSFVRGRWELMGKFKDDVILAPRLLVEGMHILGDRALVVRYEELVRDPDAETRRLCAWLGIAHSEAMVHYGQKAKPEGRGGDHTRIDLHDAPVAEYVSSWEGRLGSPQARAVFGEVLDGLGPEVVSAMGYSYDHMRGVLDEAESRNRKGIGWLFARLKGWTYWTSVALFTTGRLGQLLWKLRRRGPGTQGAPEAKHPRAPGQ
jgi:hypothetical protein